MSMDVDTRELTEGLRAAMRRHAQGVTVVSALDGNGARVAMTASAVTSVSFDPPSLLVCVNRSSSLYPALSERLPFCVNMLSRGMEEIANRCAFGESGDERFALGNWSSETDHGLPYLKDAAANLFCQPEASLDYGTHTICVGRLFAISLGADSLSPLIYVAGAYHGID